MNASGRTGMAGRTEDDVMGGDSLEAHASPSDIAAGADSHTQDGLARATLDQRQADPNYGELDDSLAQGRLLFWVADALYSGALVDLREAVPATPTVTAVPFSPAWLYGVFPLRTELVTLVDPSPFLRTDDVDSAALVNHGAPSSGPALLVGENGRLVGLLVHRIGDIVGASPKELADATGTQDYGSSGEGAPATDLDLAAIYSEIIAKLEAWATHV